MIHDRVAPLLLVVLLASPARAQENRDIHVVYQAYAAGMHVANVEAGFGFGPWSYQVRLAYHTVGLAGFFYEGHQLNTVTGSWADDNSAPHEYSGDGTWRGRHRSTLIDYLHGQPRIRSLVPPNETERQAVPSDLQTNTVDTLSALAELMRHVAATGTCDGTVHTYDGRRLTEATSHTVGIETVQPTNQRPSPLPDATGPFTDVPDGWPMPAVRNGTYTGLCIGADIPEQRDASRELANDRPGAALTETPRTAPPGIGGA